MKTILFCTLFLFFYHPGGEAQPGTLDPSYGTAGHVVVGADFAASVFQHDGKLLGVLKNGQNQLVYRYNTDGTLDATFGNGGVVIAHVLAVDEGIISVTESIDGKIVILNKRSNFFPTNKIVIVRLEKDGHPDLTFGIGGVSITNFGSNHGANFLEDVAVKYDGEIVVTGNIGAPGGSYLEYSRFNNSGERIFSEAIVAPGYFHTGPTSLAIQADGKMFIGGYAIRLSPFPGNQFIFFLSRLNTDGTRDGTFGTDGMVLSNVSESAHSVSIAADGKIIVSGSGNKILRYTPDGSLDASFGKDGIVETEFDVNKIIIESNGNIITAGGTESDFAVARYNPSGELDQSFGTGGKAITDFGRSENITDVKIDGDRLLAYGSGVLAAYRLSTSPGIVAIKCPSDINSNNDLGKCGALINFPSLQLVDESGQPVDGGSPNFKIIQSAGLPWGSVFPVGTTTNTYTIETGTKTAACSFAVTIHDNERPGIQGFTPSTNTIWPPNNKMVDIGLSYHVTDNCSTPDIDISVASNEVPVLKKKEILIGDWQVIDPYRIQLRAEKSGNNARTYTVTITATDKAGNKTKQQLTVTVPGNNSGKREAYGEDIASQEVRGNEPNGLSVKVLSNPAPGNFTLLTRSNSNGPIALKVYDGLGRIVDAKIGLPANGTTRIGGQYHRGMYFAEVKQGTNIVLIKLIKL